VRKRIERHKAGIGKDADMARPILLFTGPWSDLPLEELAARASGWGYRGLELACWGDHLDAQRAAGESGYCSTRLDLLARHDLTAPVLGSYRVGHAVCGPVDERLRSVLPEHVWGDGDAAGVQERATEEMIATIRAAQQLGAGVVAGFSGSPNWNQVAGWPEASPSAMIAGFRAFAERWHPILDVCRESGVRFALEVHPGQIAFDLYSAELALESLDGREEFGFLLDPSHLHWQGVDPVEFVHRFRERVFHVHVKDIALTLNGRSSVLNSGFPPGDARRGWDYRSPGHGGVDWQGMIRALNSIGYEGALSVDWKEAGMNRDYGAEDACKFVKRLDFDFVPRQDGGIFK
jgi:sugar phosphate isomerase/epimerase